MSGGLRGASLRYDRAEDRMVLRFDAGGRAQRFWITRRQCAGLIASLTPAALKAAAALSMPRGRSAGDAASGPDGQAPALLAVISLRRMARAVRLGFKTGADVVTLDCSTAEFVRLQCLFYRLAKASGWALEPERVPRNAAGSGAAPARRLH